MTTDTMLVGTFDDTTIAGKAMKALRDEGFREGNIKILQGDAEALVAQLVERGFEEEEARDLADAAEQGKTLLSALVSADKADQAASIMDGFESGEDEAVNPAKNGGSTESVPIVEEQFTAGKKKFATGGVRVKTSVEERPVEETVSLRQERVDANERPADRELTDDEANAAFEEKSLEVIGTAEEVEISKQARVVGEVVIEKTIEDREETVRDKVRKTNVEIEEVGTKPGKEA